MFIGVIFDIKYYTLSVLKTHHINIDFGKLSDKFQSKGYIFVTVAESRLETEQ